MREETLLGTARQPDSPFSRVDQGPATHCAALRLASVTHCGSRCWPAQVPQPGSTPGTSSCNWIRMSGRSHGKPAVVACTAPRCNRMASRAQERLARTREETNRNLLGLIGLCRPHTTWHSHSPLGYEEKPHLTGRRENPHTAQGEEKERKLNAPAAAPPRPPPPWPPQTRPPRRRPQTRAG